MRTAHRHSRIVVLAMHVDQQAGRVISADFADEAALAVTTLPRLHDHRFSTAALSLEFAFLVHAAAKISLAHVHVLA